MNKKSNIFVQKRYYGPSTYFQNRAGLGLCKIQFFGHGPSPEVLPKSDFGPFSDTSGPPLKSGRVGPLQNTIFGPWAESRKNQISGPLLKSDRAGPVEILIWWIGPNWAYEPNSARTTDVQCLSGLLEMGVLPCQFQNPISILKIYLLA